MYGLDKKNVVAVLKMKAKNKDGRGGGLGEGKRKTERIGRESLP